MRTPCVSHPKNAPLKVTHLWQHDLFRGNDCAATLAAFFEYWHSIKLGASEQSEKREAKLVQYHTEAALECYLMGTAKRQTISRALRDLERVGLITIVPSRDPGNRTTGYLFHPEVANEVCREWEQKYSEHGDLQGSEYMRCVLLSRAVTTSKRPPSPKSEISRMGDRGAEVKFHGSKSEISLSTETRVSGDLPKVKFHFSGSEISPDLKITDPKTTEIKEKSNMDVIRGESRETITWMIDLDLPPGQIEQATLVPGHRRQAIALLPESSAERPTPLPPSRAAAPPEKPRKLRKQPASGLGTTDAAIGRMQYPDKFNGFWGWYTKLAKSVDKRPGNKGEAARAWLELEQTNWAGYGLDGFRGACAAYQADTRKTGGYDLPHAVRYLVGGALSGDALWLQYLDETPEEEFITPEQAEPAIAPGTPLTPETQRGIGAAIAQLKLTAIIPEQYQAQIGTSKTYAGALDESEGRKYLSLLEKALDERRRACYAA